ncbi:MAG: Ig-like domain repeat protein [Treponema sp.]|nr:Ig-like domain repeat protein [Candidatus Treponema equifaecale]
MKKSFIKFARAIVSVAAVFAAAASFSACNVGLGETVDTNPPSLTIDYPPAGAIVRDSFFLAGTCSDDKSIKEITVKLTALSGNQKGFTKDAVNATFSEETKTWSVELNKKVENSEYNGWEYPDGNYEVLVTISDHAGSSHNKTQSTTITIDNTAPLFIIKKPGVTKGNGRSKYGSTFTVDGTIAEDNEVALMEVSVFDTDGNKVKDEPFKEEYVATAGGTSVTFATFIKDKENPEYNSIYEKASKKDPDGTGWFTCSVKLTDTAKLYKDPDEETNTTTGNDTSVVYLNSDIYADLLSSKNNGAGLTAEKLNSILNGTLKTVDSSWTVDRIKEKLEQNKVDTSNIEKTLSFTLNPDADPTYAVSGYTFGDDGLPAKIAFGEQVLSIVASAGLDGVEVSPKSIKVWLKELTDSEVQQPSKIAELVKALALDVRLGKTESEIAGWKNILDNSNTDEADDATVSVQIELPKDIVAKKNYVIVATGNDIENSPFSQNKIYGFVGNANISAPTVMISSPKNSDYCKSSFTVTGSITGTDLIEMTGEFIDPEDPEGNPIENPVGTDGKNVVLAPEFNAASGTFTDNVKNLPNGTYKIRYTLEDNYAQTGKAVVMFTIDSEAPEMKILSVGDKAFEAVPAENYDFYVVPSTIYSIKGSSEDAVSGIDGIYYYIGDLTDENKVPSLANGWKSANLTASGWTISLADLNELEVKDGSTSYTLNIAALDNAGNACETQSWIKLWPDNVAPLVSLDEEVYKVILEKKYSNQVITGKAADNNISVLKVSDSAGTVENIEIGENGEWSTEGLTLAEGKLEFTVSDKAGNISSETVYKDVAAPEFEIRKPLAGASIAKSEIIVNANDAGAGIETVSYIITRDGSPDFKLEDNLVLTNGSYTSGEIDFSQEGEGTYNLSVKSVDKLGNESEETKISFYYDISDPDLTVNGMPSNSVVVNASTGTFVMSGTAADSNGIESVVIEEGVNVIEKFEIAETEKNSKDFSHEFTAITDGTHNYTVSVTDIAKKTTTKTYKVVVDTKAPTLSNPTRPNLVKLDENSFASLTVTAVDELKDNNATGISGVYYKITKDSSITAPTIEELEDENLWQEMQMSKTGYKVNNIDVSKFSTAEVPNPSVNVFYAAIDTSENIGFDATVKTVLTLDEAAPKVKVNSYSYKKNATEDEIVENPSTEMIKLPLSSEGKLNLDLSIADTNPDTLTLTLDGRTVAPTSTDNGVYTFNLSAKHNDGTESKIVIKATDENGRESAAKNISFSYDATAPEVTLDSIGNTEGFFTSTSVTAKGTAKDSNLKSVEVSLIKKSGSVNVKTETVETDQEGNWTTKFYALEDIEYTVKVVATDAYENKNSKEVSFSVDTKDPSSTLDFTKSAEDAKFLDSVFADVTVNTISDGAVYYTDKAFTLGGTVTEANLDTVKLAVTKDGTAVSGSPFTLTLTADNKWSYEQSVADDNSSDGKYDYSLELKDKAGRSTTYNYSVVIDTIAPTVTITSPNGNVADKSVSLGGTLVEDGSGVKSVKYSIVRLGKTEADPTTPIKTNKPADVNGSKWTANAVLGETEGQFRITVTITDNMGVSNTETVTKDFWFDSANPTLEIEDFASAYLNTEPVIKGSASDANGIKSILVVSNDTTEGKTNSWTIDIASDVTEGKFAKELTGLAEGKHTFTVTVTDGAEKKTTGTKTVTYDKTAPNFDDENSFIGDASKKTAATVLTSWFKNETLLVEGQFSDARSGVKEIKYTLDVDRGSGTLPASKIGSTNNYKYSGYIDGFTECSATTPHTLTLVAVDVAGNESSPVSYSIKVDKTAPTIAAVKYEMGSIFADVNGSIYTNKSNNVTIYGTISDTISGVESVSADDLTVTYTTDDITSLSTKEEFANTELWKSYADIADKTSIKGWKAVLAIAGIPGGDFNVTTKDIAGNSEKTKLFRFEIDTTAPEVTYKEFNDADTDATGVQVNGKIILSGTADDNKALDKVKKLQYKLESGEWQDLAVTVTGSYSWTGTTFDSAELVPDSKTSAQTVSFRAVALDMAGNTNADDTGYEVVIDQDSDRPVINLTSLEGNDAIISSTSITGTISDDDGITSLEYSVDNGTSWTPVTVSSGSFKIDFTDGGEKNITFKVEDKAGTTFTTNDSTAEGAKLTRPKLQFNSGYKTDNTSAVTVKIDLKAPTIEELKLASTKDETDLVWNSESWTSDTVNFGKESKYLWIKLAVTEDIALNAESVNKDTAKDVQVTVGEDKLYDTTAVTRKFDETDPDNPTYQYVIGPVDVSEMSIEGTSTVSVTVSDKSGRTSEAKTSNIYADKNAPEVTITSPNVTNGVSSDALTGKTIIRGQISDSSKIAKFYYLIPDADQKTAIPAENYTFNSEHKWIDMAEVVDEKNVEVNTYEDRSSTIWQLPVVSTKFASGAGLSFVYYATAKDNDDKLIYAEEISGSDNVYVPLYFYVEDSTGMSAVYENNILVDPKAGIPVLDIITPEEFSKTGGNVNIQGTASDDAGDLEEVLLTELEVSTTEIIGETDDAKKTSADAIANWTSVMDKLTAEVITNGTLQTVDDKKVIKALKPANWKFGVALGNVSNLGDIKSVRATIVARDKNRTQNNFQISTLENDGAAVTKIICIDKNVPVLSNVQLVQYETVPANESVKTTTPELSRGYSAGMYISGNTGNKKWYLKGTVTDDASVEGIKISSGSDFRTLNASAETGKTTGGIIYDGLGTKEMTFIVPVDTEITPAKNKTQFYLTLELDDGQHSDVTQNLSFYVDNTAPALFTTTYNSTKKEYVSSTELNHSSELKLTDNTGSIVSEENVIENSDGSYTFGDTLTEEGSGLAYVVYYFKKVANEKNNTNRVYSPMFNTNRTNDNEVELAAGKTTDKVYINSENLPALVKTVTRPSALEISYTDLGTNKNIRNGGLVKIGGSYHLISAIVGNTVTLEDEVDETFTEAEFIYAQVVNHLVTEGFDSSADTGVSNDDGDGMVEMVKQTGATYRWTSSIYSDNVKDGPAQIHVVAFDEAGNMNSGYVSTSIQNNRPRISKVYLGTDLNGNNKFEYFSEDENGAVNSIDERDGTGNGTEFGELSFYSALSADGKIQGSVTLKSSSFTAKNKLLVLPEIIGGNGDIGCFYTAADTAEEAGVVKGTVKAVSSTVAGLSLADKTGTEQTVASLLALHGKADGFNFLSTTTAEYDEEKHGEATNGSYKGIVIDNDYLETQESWTKAGGRKIKYFAFTFWDSTEETTQGTDSLYALLKVPMAVNVIDDVAPEAVIKPFWWNSKDDSSFVYDEDGNPEGHIDIDDGTGREKPGVSGTVWINGTADDETLLKELWFTSPDGEKHQIASYDGKWTVEKDGWPENWLDVEFLNTPEPTQSGHTVDFRMKINMTSYGIDTGRTVDVSAKDKTGTASKASTSQTIDPKAKAGGKLTSHYIMDFVPYIKSIYPASESVANRSRLGRFPVQAGQPMIIEGLNFATGSEYAVKFYNTNASADSDGTVQGTLMSTVPNTNVVKVEDGKIKVTAPDYSRYVEVVVDGVSTKNNTNTNGGYNIEEGYVSTDKETLGLAAANNAGTNFWTDDRYISVWQVKHSSLFAGSINPHSGVIKKVDKYNSGSGAPLNVDGSVAAAAPGGGYIYKQAGFDGAVDPVTEMNDNYYAAISSDDLKLYGYVSGRNYPKQGDNIAFMSSEVAYVSPVDEMDYTIVNGVPYYVMQDNGLGGDSGSVWGLGLCLTREGIWYDRNYFNPYNGNTIEEAKLPYIIEKQGSGVASHNRNSSTGYDSVLYQFKNPRITGWYNENDSLLYTTANLNQSFDGKVKGVDYLYISYYDSYAKCLKYAAYRVGHRFISSDSKYSKADMKDWGKIDKDNNIDIVAEMTSSPMQKGNQPEQKEFNHMTDGAAVVAGNETTSNNPTFTEIAGEWSDVLVDVTSGEPHPVIIYYNKTNRCLEVAYGNNSFPQKTSEWTKTTGIKPIGSKADFGRYVSAAMDIDGNLHVAAQDADNAKLYYLYLTKSGSTYTVAKSVAVDASNGAGRWNDIELTNPEGRTLAAIKPVISYINTSFLGTTNGVKAAFLESVSESGELVFEAITDPAYYTAGDQRTSVMASVKETKDSTGKAPVAVGFNSDMLALDFLRGEE